MNTNKKNIVFVLDKKLKWKKLARKIYYFQLKHVIHLSSVIFSYGSFELNIHENSATVRASIVVLWTTE